MKAMAPIFRPLRLLCVENRWFERKTLECLLEKEIGEWTFAENDQEALNALSNRPEGFDLVIVDHEQAEGSGIYVVHLLRLAGYTGDVLVLTVNGILPLERIMYETFDVHVLQLRSSGRER